MKTEEERLLDVGGPLQVRDRAPAPGRASVFIERGGGRETDTDSAPGRRSILDLDALTPASA